jgi:hypothetical protein
MKFMHIDLVRNKDGNAVVNWSGVLASSLIVTFGSMAGGIVFMLAVSWFSWAGLLLPAMLGVTILIGGGVRRGLQTPVDELPHVS